MTAFMLMCYLNDAFNGGIYFKNINDCLYYSERLSDQSINVPIKVEKYECMCKLIPNIDEKKVKVYQEVAMLTALIGPVSNLLGKFIEDKDAKNKLAHELATMAERHAQELSKGQIEANTAQAKHPSLFVAGARPAIMWICALGLLTQFFIMPIAEWATAIWMPEITLPSLATGELMTLTLSLLGLGGMRSFEKSKGVARESMKK